jgi:hypothetical protein
MKKKILIILRLFLSFFNSILINFLSLIRVLLYSKLNTNCAKLQEMNERVFVLGNGNSLKLFLDKNIKFLTTENVIVVNDFFLSEYFKILRPNVYIIADPAYWQSQVNEEMKILRKKMIAELLCNVNWKIIFFVPTFAYETGFFQKNLANNPNIEIQPFNTTQFIGMKKFKFYFYDKLLAKPFSNNVIGSALFIALQMNIQKVYLFGVEHSWSRNLFVDEFNRTCIKDEHFYSNSLPAKIWLKSNMQAYRINEALADIALMLGGYNEINEYAIHKGINIYNCTNGSFIDAFERKKPSGFNLE